MSSTRSRLKSLVESPAPETKPKMSPEDVERLRKIKIHRAQVAGWHPGDDSPFQEYSGYTVSDARAHMTRIKQDIEAKYGITHQPSPAALARQNAKSASVAQKRAEIDAKVREQFPDLDKALKALWAQELYQRGKPGKYNYAAWQKRRDSGQSAIEVRKLKRSLVGTPFKSHAQAANYRAQANKLKAQLLIRAGLRK